MVIVSQVDIQEMTPFRPVYKKCTIRRLVQRLYSESEIRSRWSNEMFLKKLWGRAVVARQAHNLEAGGSNPSPATN